MIYQRDCMLCKLKGLRTETTPRTTYTTMKSLLIIHYHLYERKIKLKNKFIPLLASQ